MNDASMLLKPLLSRGELRCIGATTPDKYRWVEVGPVIRMESGVRACACAYMGKPFRESMSAQPL